MSLKIPGRAPARNFTVYNMSPGQKLKILKICLKVVILMILGSLEAAPEDSMHLRRLIKGSNGRLGHCLLGKNE